VEIARSSAAIPALAAAAPPQLPLLLLVSLLNTCRHAFAADSLLSLVYQIVRGSYPPIPADMFSADMQHLVQQLLTSDAAQRPSLQQVRCAAQPAACIHITRCSIFITACRHCMERCMHDSYCICLAGAGTLSYQSIMSGNCWYAVRVRMSSRLVFPQSSWQMQLL
jgi:hypothetical protein